MGGGGSPYLTHERDQEADSRDGEKRLDFGAGVARLTRGDALRDWTDARGHNPVRPYVPDTHTYRASITGDSLASEYNEFCAKKEEWLSGRSKHPPSG